MNPIIGDQVNAPDEVRRGFAPERKTMFVVLFIFVCGFRLFLSGDRDILALNSPYDEYWFVHNAARMIWGGEYSQLAFAHLPIYSMWLASLNVVGIPARLGIDLAWLFSIGYVGYALFRMTNRVWVGAFFWLFCAFHPLFFVLFDRALSETLLSVLLALVVGSGIEIWNTRHAPTCRRGRLASWVFVIGFALAFHIRKEGVLLLAPLFVLAAYSLVRRGEWWRRPFGVTLGGRFLVLPLLAMVMLGSVLAGINYLRWGLAVRYELAAPGYQRAMAALNRIDVGRGPLHVTVTSKARQRAYEHSPTFRELRSFFEGEQGKSLAAHTAQFTGQQGEIGNGWFYWALRDAGAVAGWHSSAKKAEQKYAAVADELEDAFRSGRLKSYSGLFSSFLDPDFGKWISRTPSSTLAALGLILETRPGSVQAASENATPKQFSEFVEIVGRRNPLPSVGVRGWIIVPEGAALALAQAGKDPSHWSVLGGQGRPDVPGAYPFSLASSGIELPNVMLVKNLDGKIGRVAISDLREGAMGKTAGEVSTTFGVDELTTGERATRVERWMSYLAKKAVKVDWIGGLSSLYAWLNTMFVALMLVMLMKLLARKQWGTPIMALLLIGSAAIVSRGFLFGILDASSWNGVQARYMAPLIPIFACMAAVAAWGVFQGKAASEGAAKGCTA